jgi:hypothetical protein
VYTNGRSRHYWVPPVGINPPVPSTRRKPSRNMAWLVARGWASGEYHDAIRFMRADTTPSPNTGATM